jgi:hypothetical protein
MAHRDNCRKSGTRPLIDLAMVPPTHSQAFLDPGLT